MRNYHPDKPLPRKETCTATSTDPPSTVSKQDVAFAPSGGSSDTDGSKGQTTIHDDVEISGQLASAPDDAEMVELPAETIVLSVS